MIKQLAALFAFGAALAGCSGSREEAIKQEPRVVEISKDDLPYRLELWDFNRDDRIDGIKLRSKGTAHDPTERDSSFRWLTEEYRGKVKGDLNGYTEDLDVHFADAATLASIHTRGVLTQAKNRLEDKPDGSFRPSR